MSTASLAGPPDPDHLPRSIWRAPLVPAALSVTAGVVLDRSASLPLAVSLVAAAFCLLAWLATQRDPRSRLSLVYLTLAGVAFGAAYHQFRRDTYAPDDIGRVAPPEARPAQLRGRVDEEPRYTPESPADPLRGRPRMESASIVLRVTALSHRGEWARVSGRVRLFVSGKVPELHIGDEVEAVGRLVRIDGPGNPGEFDYAAYSRDQGVRATLIVRQPPAAVTRLARGWPTSWRGWLSVIRGWGQRVLVRTVLGPISGVAAALLLGDSPPPHAYEELEEKPTPMTNEDWDKYKRTGVLHVLAISGQHLVVLAGFLWFFLRQMGVRQRRGAMLVAGLMLFYALLAGGRPPAMRAAVGVGAVCGALALRRRVLPANLFALAWLAVVLLDPADVADQGCLLSFLCVAVLYWGVRTMFPQEEDDPLVDVKDKARPLWLRQLRGAGKALWQSYVVSVVMWIAVAPLVAYFTHTIPVAGILLGPPLTVLTSIALIAGFLLLTLAIPPFLAFTLCVPAAIVYGNLFGCEWLVDRADAWRTHLYVPDVPIWWLVIYYSAFLAWLTQLPLRVRWRWGVVAGLGWLCVGLLAGAARLPDDELRCTFLAVGHGGCTVLETPEGRTILYDAGAMSGPEVTARRIAPYLWSRGIRRIDELILSHADLDHFNGLPDLLDRFPVGQVSMTGTFAHKPTGAVRRALAVLDERGIRTRLLKAGDRLHSGSVTLGVLHPPEGWREDDTENARSLVLRVRHAGHTILLTGDLEGAGLERVLHSPKERADILMAPHHGSHRVDGGSLARWCRARLVVSCQGPPRGRARAPAMYARQGARFWSTHEHGAVIVRSSPGALVAQTFRSRQVLALRELGEKD
jgi:competence protein ComEC